MKEYKNITVTADDDYFNEDDITAAKEKLKRLKMELPKENNPMWHNIQDIIKKVKENGYYEEPSSLAINTFKDYAKNHIERKELFKEYGLKLTQKGSNYIFEFISKSS